MAKISSGKNNSHLGSSGKSTFSSSAKSSKSSSSGKSSSGFAFTGKPANTLNIGKTSSPKPIEKSGGFLGSSGKPSPPLLVGGKSSFNPKSYPSTSSTSPKKSSTSFGIIWIPTRKNKKKEYVHVSHNYDGRERRDRSPSMYPFEHMSGDSSSHQPFKKKEDDVMLVPERPKGPIATAASAGVAVASVEPQHGHAETQTPDDEKQEKQELIKYDREDSKEAAGDMTNEDKDDKTFLENESVTSKSHDNKWEKGDKVDSVYLRPPPPHKVRSTASSNEEDDCGIKCLYYTLQCCDCVLM